MTSPQMHSLLATLARTHASTEALGAFCPYPADLRPGSYVPFHVPAADLMASETGWDATHPLAAAFLAASPDAQWRETYKDTDIGADFMARFGCYCLIGPGGPRTSDQMHAYVVYMPPHLRYPAHHHPAEELYFVLAGEGLFSKDGHAPQALGQGAHMFHASNQWHALETRDHPVMALVLWRNGFGIPPVWTEPQP
ncbi:dimethylsulfonioproprionate lyase family protein [Roseobacteraceae bacterium S113]